MLPSSNCIWKQERQYGEILKPESPLIRKDFDSAKNLALPSHSIQERIRLIVLESGIKTKQENKEGVDLVEIRSKRSEIMNCHGFRKFFDTVCVESDMKYLPKEILMGHKREQGLDRNYYRPTSDKLLNEYLKVVENLTINDEYRLSKEVQELKEKNEDSEYVIKGKLQEKEEQIKILMSQVEKLSYENNRNKQEFIDIAEKVQAINKITKLDSTMQKRLATMEDKFNLWLEDREQKKQQEQQLKQQVTQLKIQLQEGQQQEGKV